MLYFMMIYVGLRPILRILIQLAWMLNSPYNNPFVKWSIYITSYVNNYYFTSNKTITAFSTPNKQICR